jgi:hypothetical protein
MSAAHVVVLEKFCGLHEFLQVVNPSWQVIKGRVLKGPLVACLCVEVWLAPCNAAVILAERDLKGWVIAT